MENILIIAMIVVSVIITISVLLQKSSSMGLGAYSGSNDSVFGAKGPASFLAKTTFTLGFVFVLLTISLGVVYNSKKDASVTDSMPKSQVPSMPTTPVAPVAPNQQ